MIFLLICVIDIYWNDGCVFFISKFSLGREDIFYIISFVSIKSSYFLISLFQKNYNNKIEHYCKVKLINNQKLCIRSIFYQCIDKKVLLRLTNNYLSWFFYSNNQPRMFSYRSSGTVGVFELYLIFNNISV